MFFPSHHQTLVLAISAGKAISKMRRHIVNERTSPKGESIFTGTIKNGNFKLTPHQNVGNNFVPLIQGEILNSSKGSIVRSHYSINKNTKMFLVFISGLCLISAVLMLTLQGSILKSCLIFGLGLSNYGISLYQYNREVKKTIESFNKVFGERLTTER